MKKITIDKNNIEKVYDDLKVFFESSFKMMHNFDCGWYFIKPYNVNEKFKYIDDLELDRDLIRITLHEGISAFVIKVGDEIIITKNKIKHRQNWLLGDRKYIYRVLKHYTMSKKEESKFEESRYLEQLYNDDYRYDD